MSRIRRFFRPSAHARPEPAFTEVSRTIETVETPGPTELETALPFLSPATPEPASAGVPAATEAVEMSGPREPEPALPLPAAPEPEPEPLRASPIPAPVRPAAPSRVRVAPLPAPWNAGDVGAPPLKGSSRHAEGTFTVTGSGPGFGPDNEAFQFVDRMHKGDGVIAAHVGVDEGSTAGLMFRATAEPGAPFVGLTLNRRQGVSFLWRGAAGGESCELTGPGGPERATLKLVREGNVFTGYACDGDGAETQIGSTTVALRSHVFLGLAVSGGEASGPARATFEGVCVT